MPTTYRDFVWECDYGEHSFVLNRLKEVLATQNAYQLAYCFLYANNNPYNLEFYVVFGYETPVEGQIDEMKKAMAACGARYRSDLTNDDLFSELTNSRFQHATTAGPDSVDIVATHLFWYKDRSKVASAISMKPLGKTLPVFLSHSSHNKPFVEDLIPYLNSKGLPVWYDKVNIQYGETIVAAIQDGIVESGAVIFFVTPEFLASSWCKTEMEGFLNRYGSGHKVLLLCVVANDVAHDRLPPFLQMKKYLRLSDSLTVEHVANELTPALKMHFGL
ncbi:toll/interleukin-1 receptor domain-containing protein [Massilia sp. CMS3.1]|uniref:toll/interleukin-1 receptor domain-containing protein n=1 Tax=Massilia sp. CMS3.1 TaxID=3373083 RepID=UPI003EE4546C